MVSPPTANLSGIFTFIFTDNSRRSRATSFRGSATRNSRMRARHLRDVAGNPASEPKRESNLCAVSAGFVAPKMPARWSSWWYNVGLSSHRAGHPRCQVARFRCSTLQSSTTNGCRHEAQRCGWRKKDQRRASINRCRCNLTSFLYAVHVQYQLVSSLPPTRG